MKISMSPTRQQFPLSPKKIIKKTITSTLMWVILLLIFYGISSVKIADVSEGAGYYFGITTAGSLIFILIVIVLVYFYQRWYYAVYFYDLTPDYLVIKKGPITPREITVPYERFQDVYVDQDIFDRVMGLYDVHISSATISSGMQAHIDGVEKIAADGLRALLLQKVNEKIGRKS